jgi:hypothetical protein
MRLILSVLVSGSLMACAASKPIFISDSSRHAIDGSIYSGQATVYVIRDGSEMGGVWPISIKLDGEERGSLRTESFVHFSVTPGRHDIWARWPPLWSGQPDVAVNVEFEGDKTYYFVFSTSLLLSGGLERRSSLGLVDRSTGEAMTSRYKSREVVTGR